MRIGAKMQQNDIKKKYPQLMENVLLILHELQKNNSQNYLTEEDLIWLADYLNVTHGQIYGLATYYSLFSLKPRGRHIIRVCRSPVCQMIGAGRIFDQIKRILNLNVGETTYDGIFTLEATECIGQCDRAPCLSVDDAIYGGVEPSGIEAIFNIHKKIE
jgi:NADH-quinone oxidoreductase subunit E